jgi:DNA-binding NarL/FixJ family response regulator
MIRVAIVEDDSDTRQLTLELLRRDPEIVCLGAYANAERAEKEIPGLSPQVVLMDINLPERGGIECVQRLKTQCPKIEFLMLTTYDDIELIFRALRAGASGYLLKRSVGKGLGDLIREVAKGGAPMSMEIARMIVSHYHQQPEPAEELEKLTKRETCILSLAAEGLVPKEIADRLGITPGTVSVHLHAIYEKLHVQTRTEAVLKFLRKKQ